MARIERVGNAAARHTRYRKLAAGFSDTTTDFRAFVFLTGMILLCSLSEPECDCERWAPLLFASAPSLSSASVFSPVWVSVSATEATQMELRTTTPKVSNQMRVPPPERAPRANPRHCCATGKDH